MDSFDFAPEIKDKTDIKMIENNSGIPMKDGKGSETGVPSLDAFHEYQLWNGKNNSFDIIDMIMQNALIIMEIEDIRIMCDNKEWILKVKILSATSS